MTDTTKQIEQFRDEQWFRATKEIIDRCVAPVMYSDAMRMLYSVQELAARATPVSPAPDVELVTRESAEAAIDVMWSHNGPGRRALAMQELVAASVGAQVAGEQNNRAVFFARQLDIDWIAGNGGNPSMIVVGKPTEEWTVALYTAPVPAPATVDRDAVLEEAAHLCEAKEILFDIQELHKSTKTGLTGLTAHKLAAEIRALKGKAAPAAQAADSELSPPDVATLMRWSRALMGLSVGNYFKDRRNMLCEQAADLLSQIAAPAAVPQDDTLEALIVQHRAAITPEYEGGYQADLYGEFEKSQARGFGPTPREALDKAIAQNELLAKIEAQGVEAQKGQP